MALYTPEIIAPTDYPDIRVALGLDGTDTTTIPDSVIESRPYLRHVEGEVQAAITTSATIVSGGGDRASALLLGVVQATAARLAMYWLAGRQGEEVRSQSLGPAAVSYREGVDWMALAARLAADASRNLSRAEYWTEGQRSMSLIGRTGPTRKARVNDTRLSIDTILRRLTPEIVKGHEFTDLAHEEEAI